LGERPNFYVNAIDGEVKGKKVQSTIGILLCKTPNETVVKYTLKTIESPMGIADYQLPRQLKSQMPFSIEELQEAVEIEADKLPSILRNKQSNILLSSVLSMIPKSKKCCGLDFVNAPDHGNIFE